MTSYDLTRAAAREHVSVLRHQASDDRLAARAVCGKAGMTDRVLGALRLAPRDC